MLFYNSNQKWFFIRFGIVSIVSSLFIMMNNNVVFAQDISEEQLKKSWEMYMSKYRPDEHIDFESVFPGKEIYVKRNITGQC